MTQPVSRVSQSQPLKKKEEKKLDCNVIYDSANCPPPLRLKLETELLHAAGVADVSCYNAKYGRQLRRYFWTISHAHFSALRRPTRAVCYALRIARAYRMLIVACDLMLVRFTLMARVFIY